jgi:hypothetical protein
MYYDHPAYLVHQSINFANKAAGASQSYDKFVAFTALQIYSLGATCVTAGTSTYTGWNGTATVTTTGTGDTLQLIRVSGTSTSTYGPFVSDAAAGGFRQFQLAGTGTGSSTAVGGVSVNAGDYMYVVRGTDATAVQYPVIEYAVTPEAIVSA